MFQISISLFTRLASQSIVFRTKNQEGNYPEYASTYVHERDLSRFFALVLSLRHHLAANEQERARGRRNEYIIRGRNNG